MTAAPSSTTAAARADRAKAGPGPLFPTDGSDVSRSRRFAEGGEPAEVAPADLLLAARQTLNDLSAAADDPPLDVSDEDLTALLAELFAYAEDRARATAPA
jgi:hypothetical protein